MRLRTKISLTAILVVAARLTHFGGSFVRHGFSARERPSQLEEFLARNVCRLAIPATAKLLKADPSTNEHLSEGRKHWVEHCAICHSLDGSGNTIIGRNLCPKAPDIRERQAQGLNDGELSYTISNGIRFTGMPAWSDENSPEEIRRLVAFVRHLPDLNPEEKKQMEKYFPKSAAERALEQLFLQSGIPLTNGRKHNQ